MNVDSIKQRPTDLGEVFGDVTGRTLAVDFRVIVVTTRAGVHAGNEHEIGGEGDTMSGTRDVYLLFFEWLSERFQGISMKFGEFIKKQHPVVRQRDFSWLQGVAATDHRHVREGVVGTSNHALGDDAILSRLFGKSACDGVDLGGFQTFC